MARRAGGTSGRRGDQAAPSSAEQVERLRQVYSPREAAASAEQDQISSEPDPRLAPRKPIERARARIAPSNIEAEQAVIGALLLNSENYWRVSGMLTPESFFWRNHAAIWRAMSKAMGKQEDGAKFDFLSLGDDMRAMGCEDPDGNAEYLLDLASTTPSAANLEGWARIVVESYRRRGLINAGTALVSAGYEPEGRTADEIAAAAVAEIEATEVGSEEVAGAPFAASLKQTWKHMQAALDNELDDLPGLRFGFPGLEDALGGLEPGKIYFIGANTKIGKTILLENIAHNLMLRGVAIGEWHLEMSKQQLSMRRLSAVSGVPHDLIRRPRALEEHHWPMLQDATERLLKCKSTVFHERTVTPEKIGAQATMLKSKGLLDAMFVDYLQLIGVSGKFDRRDLEIGHATKYLRSVASRLAVPVIVPFQVNRKNQEGAVVRPPRPSDARESGSIEQDADAMILLHRPGFYDPSKRGEGVRCELALNRDGETGIFRLEDDLVRQRFLPSVRPWSDSATQDYQSTGFD